MVSTPLCNSIVILSVVDHNAGLELNNISNCNFIHSWHMAKLETQFYHGCPLSPSFKNSSLMNSHSHLEIKHKSHCFWLPSTQALTPQSEITHLEQGVAPLKCENTARCFCFVIFTPNCKCHWTWHLLSHFPEVSEHFHKFACWHSTKISHAPEVWLATFTHALYKSSFRPTFFTS